MVRPFLRAGADSADGSCPLERGSSGLFAEHSAFRTQFDELLIRMDGIAQRIRAWDSPALGVLDTLAKTAQMNEFGWPLAREDDLRFLVCAKQKLAAVAARVRDLAG